MSYTLEIKLLPRIKADYLKEAGFKKGQKSRVEARTSDDDYLTPWRIDLMEFSGVVSDDFRKAFGIAKNKLESLLPYKLDIGPDFGDMLIGYMCITEIQELCKQIYKPIKPIKK